MQSKHVFAAGFLVTALMWAAAEVVTWAASETVISRGSQWPPQAGSSYSFGGPYEIYYKAIPTSLTDLDTRDSRIIGYCIYNPSVGSITVTFQTKDASPLPLPLSGPLAAGVSACNNSPFGILSKGGWSVQAGGAGAFYAAIWAH